MVSHGLDSSGPQPFLDWAMPPRSYSAVSLTTTTGARLKPSCRWQDAPGGCSGLLNRASRFFPILQALQSVLKTGGTLLEVGSGSLGIGEYWHGPFVGCDLSFASRPVRNMQAVRCVGQQLPFRSGSFDAVV